nr:retrovirus-related Pol polyprotein from transposon opus [Tanacetum cinerariifolium]
MVSRLAVENKRQLWLSKMISEVPNVGEPSEVPNVGEPNEFPNVAEPNKVSNVADQTEIPNDAKHSDGSEESDDSDDSDFDVEYHGGEFSKAPNWFYDGGKVQWFEQIDSDGFSVVEVTYMLAGLGLVHNCVSQNTHHERTNRPYSHPDHAAVRNTMGKGNEQTLENLNRPASDVALQEYCDKYYHQLLLIIAKKVHKEKAQQDKLKKVKAYLNFKGFSGRNSKIQEVSQHYESRIPNVRREHGRGRRTKRSHSISRSPEPNPNVFSRIRSDRSESPRHRKHHYEGTSSRRTEVLSESEDSGGGHWNSRLKKQKSSIEDDDLSQPWVCEETNPFTSHGGSVSEILYEHCFNSLRLEVKNQMVLATAPLTGFSGEYIWPMGHISLPVKIGDAEHSTSTWMNIVVSDKKRSHAPERNKAMQEEIEKLIDVDIMKEVHYHNWLSNSVMVKNHDDIRRMYVDFKDLNKAFSKDGYPLPEIDWNNARATYQHLVDKAIQKKIGRNLEVYMDDLVIKSHTKQEIIRDIEETFKTLREINMKLNPKKCTFKVKEDFIVERPEDDSLAAPIEVEEELPDPWTLFIDGSSCIDEKVKKLASSFKKLSIKQVSGSENKKADALNKIASTEFAYLTKQVLVEELKEKSINEAEMLTVVEEEGNTWMAPIYDYLTKETLIVESKQARVVWLKLRRNVVINGVLYKGKREQAAIREAKSKEKMEKYYNSKVCNTSFKPGDLVYQSNDASHAKDEGKLGLKWEGPYEVTEALGKGAYKLRDRNGKLLSRT